MTKYNRSFDLSIEDMEIIEDALRRTKRELSGKLLAEADGRQSRAETDDVDETVRDIHDLLGRIHNQKVFYRPRKRTYISG